MTWFRLLKINPVLDQLKPEEVKIYLAVFYSTLACALAVFFWGLGNLPLMSFNEARRAIPAHLMFDSGDWLLPRLNGELYLTKPPLLYWASATISTLFGAASEWSLRLPSALAASAICLMAYRYALRHFGAWPALFTAQLLVANLGFSMAARRVQIEMLLAALCFAALLSALKYVNGEGGRKWILTSYFLLGLATLTKGPLCLLFVTLPLLADAVYRKQPRQWEMLRDPLGWAIYLITGLSWYAAVTLQLGPDIWLSTMQKDIVNKVHGAAGEPFYYYALWLMGDFFPASLLIFAAPLAAWNRWKHHRETMALIVAALVPFIVYMLFSDKHAKYLLPIYPLIALLLAKRLGEVFSGSSQLTRKWLLTLAIALPWGYAGFYAAAEARLFKYRYEALPVFEQWLPSANGLPIYAYQSVDERLVYYARREIPLLNATDVEKMILQKHSFLLLVENPDRKTISFRHECLVKEFKPYLKKKASLAVYGFAQGCASLRDHHPQTPR